LLNNNTTTLTTNWAIIITPYIKAVLKTPNRRPAKIARALATIYNIFEVIISKLVGGLTDSRSLK